MIGLLDEIRRALGRLGDTASITGSVLARLAWLRGQTATYYATAISSTASPLLDTGQLAAGEYEVVAGAVGALCDFSHRNAADGGNINAFPLNQGTNASLGYARLPRVTVATNERFRISNGGTAGGFLFVRKV